MDLQTRRKISRTMKGKSNFAGHKHSHAEKLQIGFSQEGHRNAANHKWTVDKETGKEHRVTGDKPRGSRWGRTSRFSKWIHAKEEREVWDKPNPVKNHEKLSPAMKAKAKARAKAAGRPYPNMVDNMWAARNEDTSADRLWGTTSLAMKYLKDTPGQGKKKMTKKVEEANIIDVPAYKRKPMTLDTLRKALTKDKMGNDKISHKDVLAKNSGVKEETVNELSKQTLSGYVSGASLDAVRHGNTLGRAQVSNSKKIAQMTGDKITQRLSGIKKAVARISDTKKKVNEQLEQGDRYKGLRNLHRHVNQFYTKQQKAKLTSLSDKPTQKSMADKHDVHGR